VKTLDGMLFILFSYDPARLLLTFGASVNKKDKVNQNTPLHWANLTSNNVPGKLLLKAGSDLNAINAKVSKNGHEISTNDNLFIIFIMLCNKICYEEIS